MTPEEFYDKLTYKNGRTEFHDGNHVISLIKQYSKTKKRKNQFSDLYDAILNIDVAASTQTGVFVGHKKEDEVFEIIKRISDLANANHNDRCKHKDCPGVLPFLIPAMKATLAAHEEYDIPTVLAIVGGVHLEMGKLMIEMKNEVGGMGDLLRLLKDDIIGGTKKKGIIIVGPKED